MNRNIKSIVLIALCIISAVEMNAQNIKGAKKISTDLFGLFFEDINYSADGGLYAELVQNRSFEYSPTEQQGWNPFSFWEYTTTGYSYGQISVETNFPIHPNNPHYMVINVEHVGKEAKFTGISGVGLKNTGFDGMVIRTGEKYNLSLLVKQLSNKPIDFQLSLQTPKGKVIGEGKFSSSSNEWQKYTASLVATESCDTTSLVILATTEGKFAVDVVSLFPEKTFKNRPNGLRPDLAQMLADMHPRFVRFPGGCLAHGDGLGNMYRWANTIGPIETRKSQRNIWGYHQTGGLGYFEFFQFCEDIDAKPLPVLPAGVSCQNSGGTWRIGGTGQRALPMDEMQAYIQEVLDLIEWANGPVTSEWGAKRAEAGHPESFNLQYIGIGNEDKITPEFKERFKMIYDAVKAKHPEVEVIGTVGPFHSGEDFDKGWKLATEENVPIVDEHYYTQPAWFLGNQHRYDSYDRKAAEVYLGEYASWGNKVQNAIAEAVYMTGLERNGDVVRMASYAPLLAKQNHIQWKINMIFFNNVTVCPTPNFYVQKMFMANQGDYYVDKVITKDEKDSTLAASCVIDSKSGDVILKLVNAGSSAKAMKVNLSSFKNLNHEAEITLFYGDAEAENTFENPTNVVASTSAYTVSSKFEYAAPSQSLTVIRIKTKK